MEWNIKNIFLKKTRNRTIIKGAMAKDSNVSCQFRANITIIMATIVSIVEKNEANPC